METLKISGLLVVAFVVANPGPVSIGVSVIFGFYILNMFYFNIIKMHYGGSWRKYARELYARIKKIFKK